MVSRFACFACVLSLCVWLVYCGAGVDGRFVYMLSPTSLLVYGKGGFVEEGRIRLVSLKYNGLFSS